jgi:hypothetical protein
VILGQPGLAQEENQEKANHKDLQHYTLKGPGRKEIYKRGRTKRKRI